MAQVSNPTSMHEAEAVAVVQASSCSSISTPSLGTCVCYECSPTKIKKKKKKKKLQKETKQTFCERQAQPPFSPGLGDGESARIHHRLTPPPRKILIRTTDTGF